MPILRDEADFAQFVVPHRDNAECEAEDASVGTKSLHAVPLGEPCMSLLNALLLDLDSQTC